MSYGESISSSPGEPACKVCGGSGLVRCLRDNLLRPEPEISAFCSECEAGIQKWGAVLRAAEEAGFRVKVAATPARRDHLGLTPSAARG